MVKRPVFKFKLILIFLLIFITSTAHSGDRVISRKTIIKRGKSLSINNSKYVSGEILIKLKAQAANLNITTDSNKNIVTRLNSLNKLNKDYKVYEMIPLTSDVKKKSSKSNYKNLEKRGNVALKTQEKMQGLQRIYKVKLKGNEDLIKVIEEFKKDPNVAYAEPNYIVQVDATPNDANFSKLWGLNNTGQDPGGSYIPGAGTADADIDAVEAWDLTQGSGNIVVAVIDTGVDYTHVDLAANMWINTREIAGNGIDEDGNGYIDDIYGINAINNSGDPMDDHGHGTHVAGTIGGVGNNGIGVTGVSWNVSIMALKFLNSENSGTTADAIECINYAIEMGADIMNNSWGGGGFSQALYDAIEVSNKAGMLFIASAGNDGTDNDATAHYPSNFGNDNIISVAATDFNDALADFSNYGATTVDVAAPGVDIYSCIPGNGYDFKSGTSMATPHVSGLAALIWAEYGLTGIKNTDVKELIMCGSDKNSSLTGKTVSGGRINAYLALTINMNTCKIYKRKRAPNDDRDLTSTISPGNPDLQKYMRRR